MKQDFSVFKTRRNELVNYIKEKYPDRENSVVMFIAGFEHTRARFWQESSFFYYSGITEPGAVLIIDISGATTLYIPNCGQVREKWVYSPIALTQANAKILGIDTVSVLGDQCVGYQLFPFFNQANYNNVLTRLQKLVERRETLFTLYPKNEHEYVEQRLVLNRVYTFVPSLSQNSIDISPLVADMRRRKDGFEVDRINKAVEITELAHEAAAQAIELGILECEVQASLEYMMTGAGSTPAFPSIVATGKNATILHYMDNSSPLKKGELVVIDIGAMYEGYCADITRTYPVSGRFTDRQKELYQIVLDTQEYIAEKAVPGMYLKNADFPEKSLHHLAYAYLKKYGYEQYFIHGIGHFLGLDVHDVGNVKEPLKENDVFTIEPGIYIPQENIGIRIEDDFWMAKKGSICLSENLPKEIKDIEVFVQQSFQKAKEEYLEEAIEMDEEVEH